MLKPPVSAVVITYNEADRITDCLESLSWTQEIIVVDSLSTDQTVSICTHYTDRIFIREWKGYAQQKNFGMTLARNEWVFFIDADERVSPHLAREIQQIYADGNPGCLGFSMPRQAFYLGKRIKHGEWGEDMKLRLVKKSCAHWTEDKSVHEELLLNGPVQYLKEPLFHFTSRGIIHHLKRSNCYSTLYARDAFTQRQRYGLHVLCWAPFKRFIKGYIQQRGYRDGIAGLVIASVQMADTFLRYFKLRLLYAGIMKMK